MISSPSAHTQKTAPPPAGIARTDYSALRFNQLCVVTVTLGAVALNLPTASVLLGAGMLLGGVRPDLSPLRAAYRALGPALGLHPNVVDEDPRAHHFAQGVGGSVLLASGLTGLAGLGGVSAVLGLLVVALALLSLSRNVCVGCLMYFQYRRLRYAFLHR